MNFIMPVGSLDFVIPWIHIDWQKLRRKNFQIVFDKAYSYVFKFNAKTSVNQCVIFINTILKKKFFYRRNIIFVFFPLYVVNFYINKITFPVNNHLAIMQRSVRKININLINAKFFCVIFCLLGDNLFNQPAYGSCMSF